MLKINEVSRLYLGVKGENESHTIQIDMTAWAQICPNAVAVILHKRNGDQAKELTGATYDSETKILSWLITSYDTFYDGFGTAEIRMVESDVVKKTKDITTVTAASITNGPGNIVESDYQSFLNAVIKNKAAAEDAQEAAEDAQEAAEDAQEAAEDAQEAAEAAQEAAEAAVANGPYIDDTTGDWFVWDFDDEEYKDTGIKAQGPAGDPTTIIDDEAGDGETGKTWSADKLASDKEVIAIEELLLRDELPGTTTTVTMDSNGNPTSIAHSASGTTVRTDAFVWSTGSVTETRTASDKYITITTNLETLAQTISEIQEVA